MCSIISPYQERLTPKSKLLFVIQTCIQHKGTFFLESRPSQKDAKLYACLISWLGACLQVWRVQLAKEHNTHA